MTVSTGRAMVDIILQAVEGDAPKLKDCLPVIGALKHLREWHSAQITIATSDSKGYAVHFGSAPASDSHPTACHCKWSLLSDNLTKLFAAMFMSHLIYRA